MKRLFFLLFATCSFIFSSAHTTDNSASTIINSGTGLHLGGYGQIDMNRVSSDDNVHHNAKLDVHRFVTFLGYNFNDRVSFVSEIEMEHVVELYVEQAFLNYRLKDNMSLQAGLMLVPMGIQNLYHEPPTFNGVERTNVDKYIVPTTWREMGIGIAGTMEDMDINYQLMAINGFNGYDEDGGVFSGKSGLRSGRQKGAESYMTELDFAGRISYFGMPGWNFGASMYRGDSETILYNELDLDDANAVAIADSSKIGIDMLGIDARYVNGAFQARGQYVVGDLSNTDQYNAFTGSDVGSKIQGYYAEVGYDIMSNKSSGESLVLFARTERYNTHAEVDGIDKNKAYNRTENTFGLTWHVAKGAAFKVDYQTISNKASDSETNKVNMGVAVWF